MIHFFALILCLVSLCVHAQTNDVTIVVSSKGNNEEEAKAQALRSAVEQAFGTFVSSRTEILNDELVQDQIVSLSTVNIKKYEAITYSSGSLTEYSHLCSR